MEKPPVPASLVWEGDLRFRASSGTVEVRLDGHSTAGPSLVQTLAFSLAGCMAMDVVDILRIELHFDIRGNPPAQAVERALQLSRDRYCSVWHSMREDIELTPTFEVES